MTDEQSRTDANDRVRSDDRNYTLSIEQAGELYAKAGHPRTIRAIQKYCALQKLDCRKVDTDVGVEKKYLVAAYSVERHIAYINEMRPVAISRDESRTDAIIRDKDAEPGEQQSRAANTDEQSRTDATGRDNDSRYVARLEDDNQFLRGQLTVKDKTIDALLERDRESNILVGQLQQLLAPLLSAPGRESAKSAEMHKAPSTEVPQGSSQAVPRNE